MKEKYQLTDCGRFDPFMSSTADLYFSETSWLMPMYSRFLNILPIDEQLQADRFHYQEIRQTYVISHGFLRLLLGWRTGMNPSEIIIRRDAKNKPFLKDNPVYFNLSHTKNAFVIALCPDFQIGIDCEIVNHGLDTKTMSGIVLDSREQLYVEENPAELHDRFFLLWTRKEAYLKAIGNGITCDMWKIRSFQKRESLKGSLMEDRIINPPYDDYFVYSEKISSYILSIAAPGRIKIQTHVIDEVYCEKEESLVLS